ncbi:hypothetical protein ScalyP_jg169, partial [Parmales sp. scaly parma]
MDISSFDRHDNLPDSEEFHKGPWVLKEGDKRETKRKRKKQQKAIGGVLKVGTHIHTDTASDAPLLGNAASVVVLPLIPDQVSIEGTTKNLETRGGGNTSAATVAAKDETGAAAEDLKMFYLLSLESEKVDDVGGDKGKQKKTKKENVPGKSGGRGGGVGAPATDVSTVPSQKADDEDGDGGERKDVKLEDVANESGAMGEGGNDAAGKDVISKTAYETFTATSFEIAQRCVEAFKSFYAMESKKERALVNVELSVNERILDFKKAKLLIVEGEKRSMLAVEEAGVAERLNLYESGRGVFFDGTVVREMCEVLDKKEAWSEERRALRRWIEAMRKTNAELKIKLANVGKMSGGSGGSSSSRLSRMVGWRSLRMVSRLMNFVLVLMICACAPTVGGDLEVAGVWGGERMETASGGGESIAIGGWELPVEGTMGDILVEQRIGRRLEGCATVAISGCEIQSLSMTTYALQDDACNGKPMYTASNGRIISACSNGVWAVGPVANCGSSCGGGIHTTQSSPEPFASSGANDCSGPELRMYEGNGDNPGSSYEEKLDACFNSCISENTPLNGATWSGYNAIGFTMTPGGRCYCESQEVSSTCAASGSTYQRYDYSSCASCGSGKTTTSTGSTSASQCSVDVVQEAVCNAVAISGCEDTSQSSRMAKYDLQGVECNGKPKYRASNGAVLFACLGGEWVVGNAAACGSSNCPAGIQSTLPSPEPFTSSGWACSNGNGWISYDLDVVCVDSTCSSACGVGSGCEFAEGSSTGSCLSCPIGKYSDTSSAALCSSCGSGSSSSTGSISVSQCICDKGYYLGATSCERCTGGTSTVAIGATSADECIVSSFPTSFIAVFLGIVEVGSELEMMPGEFSSGVGSDSQLILSGKTDVKIMCEDRGTVNACTWKGASRKRVVEVSNNYGTITVGFVTIREGDFRNTGGGMYVESTTIKAIVCRFIDNNADRYGGAVFVIAGGSVSLEGCHFSGNSAGLAWRDITKDSHGGTVSAIARCPAGYSTTQESNLLSAQGFSGVHSYSCTMCDAGSGSSIGDTSCSPCPIGTSSTGGTACLFCPFGMFTSSTSSTLCDFCPPSTHLSDNGISAAAHDSSDDCLSCEAGRYSDTFGFGDCAHPTCLTCPAGQIGNAARTSCSSCPIAKYSTAGSGTCAACNGDGEYADVEGSGSCKTAPGGYEPNEARTGMNQCPAGTKSGDGFACVACDGEGEYSEAGALACSIAAGGHEPNDDRTGVNQCPEGTKSSDGFACVACDGKGEYSVAGALACSVAAGGKKPNADRSDVVDCAEDTYSDGGENECSDCGDNKYAAAGSSGCYSCIPGQRYDSTSTDNDNKGDFRVMLNSSTVVLVAECKPCEGVTSESGVSKEGLICNEVGLTTETLKLSPGYWRSGNSSVKIEMCENIGDCPQKNVTQQCADGHEGPICANCLPDHTRSVSGGCEECEETSTSSMLMLLACLIISLILSRVLKRKLRNTSIADVHNKKHWANRLKTKAKILSSSFQIVCEFAATLKVSFPPVFSEFTKWVSTIVQFDFISIGSFGCMMDMNYYGSLLLYTLAPIGITLLLAVYNLLGK